MKALALLPLFALVSCVGIRTTATSTTIVAVGGRGSVNNGTTTATWNNEKSFADGANAVNKALNSAAVRAGAVSVAGYIKDAVKK